MTGCTYCGTPDCEWETCPERLEDRHGVPSDYDDKGQLKTDGGVTSGDETEQLAQYSATIWGGQAHAQRVIHTPQAVLQTRLDGRLNRSDNPLPDGVLQSVRLGSHRVPHHKLDIFPYGFSSREHQEAWQGALSLQKQGDCTDRSLQPGIERSGGEGR